MKRVWHYPEQVKTGKHYWRSLGELNDTPQFREWLEREFPQGAAEMAGEEEAEVSRRNFLKLMGAATSLAGFGMAACRRPDAFLVPFSENVEWSVPGKALLYSTAMPTPGGCAPLVVTTYDGRPTHLQGNSLHPSNGNGTDSFVQQSILDLYDPDRAQHFLMKGEKVTREDFDEGLAQIKKTLAGSRGREVAFLVGESTSPTRQRLIKKLSEKYKFAKFFCYEALSSDNVRAANRTAFGRGVTQVPKLEKAKRVLSLDCDFLGLDKVATNPVRDFMQNRRVDDHAVDAMNRLYTVEANFTVTGGMADHRLRTGAGQVFATAAAMAGAVAELTGNAGCKQAASAAKAGKIDKETQKWVDAVAKDLVAHKGEAVVLAGAAQPEAVQLLAAAVNQALGSFGKTIDLLKTGTEKLGTLEELAELIKGKLVSTLFITTGADPAYDAPADLGWKKLQESVENVVHLGVRHRTATARSATWSVPGAHYLESWGDVRAADGTLSVVQPMILPLYGGLSEIDFFLELLSGVQGGEKGDAVADENKPSPAYEAVRKTFAKIVGGDVEKAWNHALRDGFVPGTYYVRSGGSFNTGIAATAIGKHTASAAPTMAAMEVVFRPDGKIWDGRYINNGWAQEAPDPVTKLTWDNAALVSLTTAKALGIKTDGQLLKIEVNGEVGYFPALQAPGHADNSVTIPLGYGQAGTNGSGPGRVGEGVGFNAYPLRTSSSTLFASGAKVALAGDAVEIDGQKIPAVYDLALTQEHNNMYERALVREGTTERFQKNPRFAKKEGMDSHIPENVSLYKPTNEKREELPLKKLGDKKGDPEIYVNDQDHQWGMTIDLNQCLGCNACLIACQSENNIPIVGKEQVIIGREMHWIRMDRYFATADPHEDKGVQNPGKKGVYDQSKTEHWDNPEMVVQPVACQQCELAPCETVCPVNATVHTEEGLNAMAYNRCIGTRYCANNCPYKARRFNFFDYNKRPLDQLLRGPLSDKERTGMRESSKLQKNPNVTVRMRGVMEKCTYCVQRIQEAKITQKRIGRGTSDKRVPTNAVKVACQQACSAEAISFGNLLNPDDDVTKKKVSPRSYDLLAYVGARPRTSYLARIKNPNPEIAADKGVGEISEHIH